MAEIHDGHRSRMFDKLQTAPNSLCDHELLEILLFFVLPRVNTNPIAHELLDRFGSLDAVFKATPTALQNVEGIGKQAALYIHSVGILMKQISEHHETIPQFFNPFTFDQFVKKRYASLKKEVLDIYFIDQSNCMTGSYRIGSDLFDRVKVNPRELMSVLASTKAYGITLVHNHVDGTADPSKEDDRLTKEVQLLCSVANLRFFDHVIYSPYDVFSYYTSNRMEEIAEKYHINRLV